MAKGDVGPGRDVAHAKAMHQHLPRERLVGQGGKTGVEGQAIHPLHSQVGEEAGLLGSTEWVETHAAELAAKAVAYVNSDSTSHGILDAGELAAASQSLLKLDKNGDGLVSFPEFADWYVNKVKPPPAAAS